VKHDGNLDYETNQNYGNGNNKTDQAENANYDWGYDKQKHEQSRTKPSNRIDDMGCFPKDLCGLIFCELSSNVSPYQILAIGMRNLCHCIYQFRDGISLIGCRAFGESLVVDEKILSASV
jgi:hypothetical protein